MSLIHRFRHLRMYEATEFRATARTLARLGLYARTHVRISSFPCSPFLGLDATNSLCRSFRFFFFVEWQSKMVLCVHIFFRVLLPMLVMCFYPRFTFFYSHCCVLSLPHRAVVCSQISSFICQAQAYLHA